MKRKQSVEEDLAKKIKLLPKAEDNPVVFLPSFSGNQKFSKSTLKKHIARRFSERQFEQLKQEISFYGISRKELADFFSSEDGNAILNVAVVGESDPAALDFLSKYAPKGSLKSLLEKDNFSILKAFLLSQRGLEAFNQYTEEERSYEIEKFKLLLEIHPEGIQKFMQDNSKEKYITEVTNANFLDALQQYKKTLSIV